MYGFWGNARDLKRRFAQIIRDYNSQSLIICVSLYPEAVLRSCFEFLQKVFLGLMYPFSCVLWAIFWSFSRQIARYLPHHRSENASKTHPKSSHDKFKTASEFLQKFFLS